VDTLTNQLYLPAALERPYLMLLLTSTEWFIEPALLSTILCDFLLFFGGMRPSVPKILGKTEWFINYYIEHITFGLVKSTFALDVALSNF
jgi:hypothetical protein